MEALTTNNMDRVRMLKSVYVREDENHRFLFFMSFSCCLAKNELTDEQRAIRFSSGFVKPVSKNLFLGSFFKILSFLYNYNFSLMLQALVAKRKFYRIP